MYTAWKRYISTPNTALSKWRPLSVVAFVWKLPVTTIVLKTRKATTFHYMHYQNLGRGEGLRRHAENLKVREGHLKHETTIKKKTNLHVVWKQNALWNLVIKSLSITFQTFTIFWLSLFFLCLFVYCLLLFKTLKALFRPNNSAILCFSLFVTFTALRVVFLSIKIIPVYKVIRIQIPLQNQQ